MTAYHLGNIGKYQKRMGADATIAYVDALNESSMKVHDGIGTFCSPAALTELISDYGEMTLGTVPWQVLPYHPNADRKPKVEEMFVEPVDISLIPPILVRDFSQAAERNYRLELLDGQTRSGVAFEKQVPLMGYAPEKVTRRIPGFEVC
jgi:hypothetical protein